MPVSGAIAVHYPVSVWYPDLLFNLSRLPPDNVEDLLDTGGCCIQQGVHGLVYGVGNFVDLLVDWVGRGQDGGDIGNAGGQLCGDVVESRL